MAHDYKIYLYSLTLKKKEDIENKFKWKAAKKNEDNREKISSVDWVLVQHLLLCSSCMKLHHADLKVIIHPWYMKEEIKNKQFKCLYFKHRLLSWKCIFRVMCFLSEIAFSLWKIKYCAIFFILAKHSVIIWMQLRAGCMGKSLQWFLFLHLALEEFNVNCNEIKWHITGHVYI